jgi:hypothetical protein
MNPLVDYLSDSINLLLAGELLQSNQTFKSNGGVTKGSSLLAIAALHCFANNLLQLMDGHIHSTLTDKFEDILRERSKPALIPQETIWFQELEEIEEFIRNPQVTETFDASSPQAVGRFDAERTKLFKIMKSGTFMGYEHATMCIGLVLIIISLFVDERLNLNEVELLKVFGETIRGDDGFIGTPKTMQVRHLLLTLKECRKSTLVQQILYRGFKVEQFSLDFLKPHLPKHIETDL